MIRVGWVSTPYYDEGSPIIPSYYPEQVWDGCGWTGTILNDHLPT